MELIDRDIFVKQLEDYIEHAESFDFQMAVIGVVNDLKKQPTVDAVPVSLIQSEIDFLTLAAEGEMEVTGQHGEVYAELAELKKLMSLWENEREKHD